jgi:hypothetical protein
MRKFMVLLAVVGATVGVVFAQASAAIVDGGREQPCQDNIKKPPTKMTLGSAFSPGGGLWSDGYKSVDGKKKSSEVSNDADQSNRSLCQNAENKPHSWVENENINKNPQFTLLGSNTERNKQSNRTWVDQSQHADATQANVLWQGISVNHPPDGWSGGGGPALSNDADQSNRDLRQTATNKPFSWVDNENVNFNPQFTLWGNNYQYNKQENSTWVDQSQQAQADQANLAGQAIHVGPPIDPKNDAHQSNGKLSQTAKNEPKSGVENKNVNFNPQFAVVGNNSETNHQSNKTSVDQSQHAGALQLNVAGQSIGLG